MLPVKILITNVYIVSPQKTTHTLLLPMLMPILHSWFLFIHRSIPNTQLTIWVYRSTNDPHVAPFPLFIFFATRSILYRWHDNRRADILWFFLETCHGIRRSVGKAIIDLLEFTLPLRSCRPPRRRSAPALLPVLAPLLCALVHAAASGHRPSPPLRRRAVAAGAESGAPLLATPAAAHSGCAQRPLAPENPLRPLGPMTDGPHAHNVL